MPPLFVSYAGCVGGKSAQGWVVLTNHPPLATPEDMTALVDDLEQARGYDKGTLILVGFQRLEPPDAGQAVWNR